MLLLLLLLLFSLERDHDHANRTLVLGCPSFTIQRPYIRIRPILLNTNGYLIVALFLHAQRLNLDA
jgi:hypothetical protein